VVVMYAIEYIRLRSNTKPHLIDLIS
jgi:hypothetical protein